MISLPYIIYPFLRASLPLLHFLNDWRDSRENESSHHLRGTFLKESLWFRELLNQVILVALYQICQNPG